jgi:hypothetical protein
MRNSVGHTQDADFKPTSLYVLKLNDYRLFLSPPKLHVYCEKTETNSRGDPLRWPRDINFADKRRLLGRYSSFAD